MRLLLVLVPVALACGTPSPGAAQEPVAGAPVVTGLSTRADSAVAVIAAAPLRVGVLQGSTPCARALPMPTQRPRNPTVPIPEARPDDRTVSIPNACPEAARPPRTATLPTPAAVSAPNPVLEIVEP